MFLKTLFISICLFSSVNADSLDREEKGKSLRILNSQEILFNETDRFDPNKSHSIITKFGTKSLIDELSISKILSNQTDGIFGVESENKLQAKLSDISEKLKQSEDLKEINKLLANFEQTPADASKKTSLHQLFTQKFILN